MLGKREGCALRRCQPQVAPSCASSRDLGCPEGIFPNIVDDLSAPLVLQFTLCPKSGGRCCWPVSAHTHSSSPPSFALCAYNPCFPGKEEVGFWRMAAPCRTHGTETCWLWLQASHKPHEGAWSSFETFVFQQPPMGRTDLTLPQNQLPTHKKEVSSACPDFSQHTPRRHSYQNPAAGPYPPSQHSTASPKDLLHPVSPERLC